MKIFDPKEDWTHNDKRMLKYMLENDGMQFMRYFFRLREGTKLIRNWHHYVLHYVLQATIDARVTRLIINIAPRYSKTETAVVNYIARGMALNPRSKFIHASYSPELAWTNSSKIKETIELQEYQELWPMKIKTEAKGKKQWYNTAGGGLYAVGAGGGITGFGAGRMEPGFHGAFIYDDPLKPADAHSTPKRDKVNDGFNSTCRSRLALETTPIIVMMQRIAEDDLTGFLLQGGSGDMWYHLKIPGLLSAEELNKPYPEEYTHGIPIDLNRLLYNMQFGQKYDFQR